MRTPKSVWIAIDKYTIKTYLKDRFQEASWMIATELYIFLSVVLIFLLHEINRPIANMATISPKRGFTVATVARVWLPVLTCAVAGKTAASQASFPLNSTKISHFPSLKEVSIWYVRFEYCFSMLN